MQKHESDLSPEPSPGGDRWEPPAPPGATGSGTANRSAGMFGIYSQSLHPLGLGLVAVLVIAAAVLLIGDRQVERSVVANAAAGHERDLLRFSESLHYSGLNLSGQSAVDGLPELASTSIFDTSINRALFGLSAERLDLYSLDGTPIYSTTGLTGAQPPINGAALEAFDAARAGQFTSFFHGSASTPAGKTELLESFALIMDVAPDSADTGRSLAVASIRTDLRPQLDDAYATLWLVIGTFLAGSLVILVVVHWASVRSRSRLQAANDALAMQNVAVRESRERMMAAADETKRAIAEELHGTVQTRLFSLWARLGQLRSGVGSPAGIDAAALEEIIDELDDVREDDIRGLSHRLHPSIVRVGAIPALRSLCERMSGAVEVRFSSDRAATELEPVGASPIPEGVRLAVYRIAELAIGNTLKHASASYCEVRWHYSESAQSLHLIVEDDGVGFDAGELTAGEFGGLGILNIEDYTDSVNGRAILKSEPGWGTTLTVSVPFDAMEAGDSGGREQESAQGGAGGRVINFEDSQAA